MVVVASAVPSLARLRLDARAAAPTAEFHELSPEEVMMEKGVKGNGKEPLTLKEWQEGQDVDSLDATFRVEVGVVKRYRYYDARALFEWLAARRRAGRTLLDPVDMKTEISEEDYQALKNRYQGYEMGWEGGRRWIYEGNGELRRLVKYVAADGVVYHYEGSPDQERKVREEEPDGDVTFYEGAKGEEREVRRTTADGSVVTFEGARGEEHVVRVDGFDGTVVIMAGERDHEYVVEQIDPPRVSVPLGAL